MEKKEEKKNYFAKNKTSIIKVFLASEGEL